MDTHSKLFRFVAIVVAACGLGACGPDDEGPEPMTVVDDLTNSTLNTVHFQVDEEAIFWSDTKIERATLQGEERTALRPGAACDIAIDAERVYYIDEEGAGSLTRDGQSDITYHNNSLPPYNRAQCSTLALDTDFAYYQLIGGLNQLAAVPKGMSAATLIQLPSRAWPPIVGAEGLYFFVDGMLKRFDSDNDTFVDVADIGSEARFLQLHANHAYWTEALDETSDDIALKRAALDTGAVEVVYSGGGRACVHSTDFAVDDTHAYLGVNLSREGTTAGCLIHDVVAIVKVPLSGGERTIISARESIEPVEQVALTSSRVYFLDRRRDFASAIKYVPK